MSSYAAPNRAFTYGDYKTWPDDERWEVIDGIAYNMTPAPSVLHQRILAKLAARIGSQLEGKECEMFIAPFDVRLPEGDQADDDVTSVVQPDISVVCDPAKLDKAGCRGAPDFVIEITSPGTAQKDRIQKKALFERHGVKEYWIINPPDNLLTIYRARQDRQFEQDDTRELRGTIAVDAVPGLYVELDPIGSLCAAEYPPRQSHPSPANANGEADRPQSDTASN